MLPQHKPPVPVSDSDIEVAKAIVELTQSEGWKQFEKIANELINNSTPNVSSFTQDDATFIASQMAFISGIKRCLQLPDQCKELLEKVKKQNR